MNTTNSRRPSSVPRQLFPRPPSIVYLVEDGRLVSKLLTTNGLVTRELCNFQATLTATLIIDDGERKRRIYTLSGRNTRGRSLPEARIDAAEFDAMRWVSDHWGAHAIISAGHSARDHLSRAILHLSQDTLREQQVYTYTGWRSEGDSRIFLCSDDAGVTLELERELEHYHLPAAPKTVEEAREAMRASLAFLDIAAPHITIPLWAALYLAPTCEFVMPRFALWLYGVTGSLKSTLAALALNHFGDWIVNDLAGWSSTANSLGKILFLAKDVPFVVDDFAPQSERHAAERQESAAAELIRSIGNHSGRARMQADLSLARVYRPRGLVISTGEQLPDVGSILSRILTVEVRRSEIDLARLKEQQDNGRARYGHAMAGFVAWLGAHWDELKAAAPHEAGAYSDQLRAGGQHLRVPDGLGLLHSGFVRALRYAEAVGALTAEQAEHWRATGWQVMLRLAEKQSRIVADERPALQFLTPIGEHLAQGKLRSEPLRPSPEVGEERTVEAWMHRVGSPDAELIGWHDRDHFYLMPGVAYNHVARFYRDEGRQFGIKKHALWRALAEEGYIETEEEHHTVRLWVNERQQRVLMLRRSAVAKLWGL
jgi:hypothetical protein